MKYTYRLLLVSTYIILFVSCAVIEERPSFNIMDKDLTALKADFNHASDDIRLIFVISPT